MGELPVSNNMVKTPNSTGNQPKMITKEEVDTIASKTCKKTTHKQMEWGIKVFKGNLSTPILFALHRSISCTLVQNRGLW